jgi:hypothetical protein
MAPPATLDGNDTRIEQSKRTHPEDTELAPDIILVNNLKVKTSR